MLNKLRNFLATQGRVRIIEAIVDPDIQVEYLEYASKVRKEFDEQEIIDNSDNIFDKAVDIDEKKRLITLMATIDDVNIYRKLEKFIEIADEDLKSWALIAHQESQTVIQSSLLEENQILISTGLGGKNEKMRFFIVLQVEPKVEISENHQTILKNEIEYSFKKHNCDIESIEFNDFFCAIVALFPFKVEIEDVFESVIIESNNLGVNLSDKFIVTNVKIHSLEETTELIKELDEKALIEEKETEDLDDFDIEAALESGNFFGNDDYGEEDFYDFENNDDDDDDDDFDDDDDDDFDNDDFDDDELPF